MGKITNKIKSLVRGMVQADITDDPDFFGKLGLMPNPDQILRNMGKADQVYASIMQDPHVLGEIRSMKGAQRSKSYRLLVGEEDNPQAQKALEICQQYMSTHKPNKMISWREFFWQSSRSVLTAREYHEMIFDHVDGITVPIDIRDRKQSRFGYDNEANLLLKTKANREGAPVDERYFIQSRNTPSFTNPYGVSILSAIFWMWTFKTGGFKYFVKYCERHGIPWAVGRYPVGTLEPEQDELAKAMAHMLESAYTVVPEGDTIELLSPKTTGSDLPQEALIVRCNKEMSKAIGGQAMVAELDGVGANAASKTAKDRQGEIHDSDNDIPANAMMQIFRVITDENVGVDVPSPIFEFFNDDSGDKERAEVYEIVSRLGDVSKKAMHDEFKIPMSEDDEDKVVVNIKPNPLVVDPLQPGADFSAYQQFLNFSRGDSATQAITAANYVIEADFIDPAKRMLDSYIEQGKSVKEFQTDLSTMLITIDDTRMRELTASALGMEALEGMDHAS